MKRRLWDGFTWGLILAFLLVLLAGVAASFMISRGYDAGRADERASLERAGVGRYVQIQLDGYEYRGWLR